MTAKATGIFGVGGLKISPSTLSGSAAHLEERSHLCLGLHQRRFSSNEIVHALALTLNIEQL